MRKVSVLSTWSLKDFKNAIAEDISSPAISDVNLKDVFMCVRSGKEHVVMNLVSRLESGFIKSASFFIKGSLKADHHDRGENRVSYSID
ncbi:hypothetical protein Tco_0805059 [Tanacetum coccineum]